MTFSRTAKDLVISTAHGMQGQLQMLTRGRSKVAQSCQIPDLRQHYQALGLPDRNGQFVEIGGYDGESWSNTSFLADQGWRGVYVEPIPEFARRIRLRHLFNKVTVERVAVGNEEKEIAIAQMGSLTTVNAATEQAYESIEWAKGATEAKKKVVVPMRTLETVLGRNHVPLDFELLVVDVEGAEEPIIDGLLASRWRPRVIIVELVDRHADFADHAEIVGSHAAVRARTRAAGYTEHFSDLINTIFVRTA